MHSIWFTSDLHFSHHNIMVYHPKFRQFENTEKMDEFLINMWNSTVKQQDIVYFLGDFAMKHTLVEEILPKLNGGIIWVMGNHDKGLPRDAGRQIREKVLKRFPNVLEMCESKYITIAGQKFVLSHFPWKEDTNCAPRNGKERYQLSRVKHPKCTLLHGHTHAAPADRVGNRAISVAYESWGRMVSIDDILNIQQDFNTRTILRLFNE